jgi:predicted nucleic acid-binding protein
MSTPDETTRASRVALLAGVLAEAPALPIDRHVAARYGELRAGARRRPSSDLWIAATALAHDFTLVTADEHQAALPLVRSTLVGP